MAKSKYSFLLFLLMALVMSISSCAAPVEVPPTATEEPVEENTPEPTEVVVDTPEAEVVDYCVDCHTEKEQLIDTAKPVVEVVSENEGAG